MNTTDWITGQIFFRSTGMTGGFGRKKMFFVGIIDVPDSVEIKDEHQYTVYADPPTLFSPSVVPLMVMKKSAVDLKEEMQAKDADGILRSPIWRT